MGVNPDVLCCLQLKIVITLLITSMADILLENWNRIGQSFWEIFSGP